MSVQNDIRSASRAIHDAEEGMTADDYLGYLVPLVGSPEHIAKGDVKREEFMLDMSARFQVRGRPEADVVRDMRRLAHFCNCCFSARAWAGSSFKSLLTRFESSKHPFWSEYLGGWNEDSDEEYFNPGDVEGLDIAKWRNNRASRKDMQMARF